jgi:hypothetical protein
LKTLTLRIILATLILVNYVHHKSDEAIFDTLLDTNNKSDVDVIQSAVHTTHIILSDFRKYSKQYPEGSLQGIIYPYTFENLVRGRKACGHFSIFLARILKSKGYETQIVQQTINKIHGSHITLQVIINNHRDTLLVDPLFNHLFFNGKGKPLSAYMVSQNWDSLSHLLPKNYPTEYNYKEGFEFSNWNKLGPLSRVIKKILSVIVSSQFSENFSIRIYIMDSYKNSIIICLTILAFTFISNPISKVVRNPNTERKVKAQNNLT